MEPFPEAFSDRRSPRRLDIRVLLLLRLSDFDQLARVVECPVENHRRWPTLDRTYQRDGLLFESTYDNLGFAFLADRGNWRPVKGREKKGNVRKICIRCKFWRFFFLLLFISHVVFLLF